ncbi:hypothetical protein PAXRUDRAFT_822323 [Paxillus rubicundulus Ve08.2h10]|uniref:Uncharacterized protein n=1 Tax=Paxillus rubicundulus Ve08.2h10 TaxID=930991 RepID=A0A0D0E5B1_9AGAM|nr:hypothetical protein PAXRUDRAFT_822323 [Paxillus rubicundulus Ve08.2h10]
MVDSGTDHAKKLFRLVHLQVQSRWWPGPRHYYSWYILGSREVKGGRLQDSSYREDVTIRDADSPWM